MDSQLEFALEPFLYPQNVTLYDKYIEQMIIDLELVLRPREAIKINWHWVTKRVTIRGPLTCDSRAHTSPLE